MATSSRSSQVATRLTIALLLSLKLDSVAAIENFGCSQEVPKLVAAHNICTLSIDADFRNRGADVQSHDRLPPELFGWNFFGQVLPSGAVTYSEVNKALSLKGGGLNRKGQIVRANSQISTATVREGEISGRPVMGDFYVEAELLFDPRMTVRSEGWPAFWALPIQHLGGLPAVRVPNIAGDYRQFIELDIFEYIPTNDRVVENFYIGSAIEWYGIWGETCLNEVKQYCSNRRPYSEKIRPIVDPSHFEKFNRYGLLYLSPKDGRSGRMTWMFNGAQIGQTLLTFDVNGLRGGADFPVRNDHGYVFILGSGVRQPLYVRYLKVWQHAVQ